MRGQREHQRFELLFKHEGLLRLVTAVDLVSMDEQDVVVLSDRPSSSGDVFVFRGLPPDHEPRVVRVVSCRSLIDGTRIRYEVRLGIEGADLESVADDDAEAGVGA